MRRIYLVLALVLIAGLAAPAFPQNAAPEGDQAQEQPTPAPAPRGVRAD